MSNYLAIATVTATLSQILRIAVRADVNGADVSIARPSDPVPNTPPPRVNIYLYQVTPNAAWRNTDLPTRRADGTLAQRPRAALDLHYLLTFFGDEAQLEPQRMLGSVVRTLHAQPILSPQEITSTIGNATFSPILSGSNLADAVEMARFTPIALTLEELSKLWSVFFQTTYTVSVAYQASVVLIEPDDTLGPALQVLTRNLYAVPLRQPAIAQVAAQADPRQFIGDQSRIRLQGRNLRGDATEVRVGGMTLSPPDQGVSATQIDVDLPPGLRAGVLGAQVIQLMQIGTPPTPHRGEESNIAPFVLHPAITKGGGGAYIINVTPLPGGVGAQHNANIAVQVTPQVDPLQRVQFELLTAGANPSVAYIFPGPVRSAATNNISIDAQSVTAGDYLLRVRVDGAESALDQDTNSASPTFGQFIMPKVTI